MNQLHAFFDSVMAYGQLFRQCFIRYALKTLMMLMLLWVFELWGAKNCFTTHSYSQFFTNKQAFFASQGSDNKKQSIPYIAEHLTSQLELFSLIQAHMQTMDVNNSVLLKIFLEDLVAFIENAKPLDPAIEAMLFWGLGKSWIVSMLTYCTCAPKLVELVFTVGRSLHKDEPAKMTPAELEMIFSPILHSQKVRFKHLRLSEKTWMLNVGPCYIDCSMLASDPSSTLSPVVRRSKKLYWQDGKWRLSGWLFS